MLPTFIIAGAGRSATTSLWEYVTAHPDVCGGTLKEPAFFTNAIGCGDKQDGKSPRLSGTFTKRIAWYESLFDGCREAKAVGEASTLYMTEEDSPALIKEHIPQVKLIFILRNPIDRIRSHYWYERRNGWPLPALDELVSQRHPVLNATSM